VGVNWSAIVKKKRFMGLIPSWEGVNLDLGVALFDEQDNMQDLIYPNKLASKDQSVRHSGDDLIGDKTLSIDNNDNETLLLDLQNLSPNISQLVFFLSSSSNTDFAHIPYSKIRVYTGSQPNDVQTLFGNFDVSANEAFSGKVGMVMGKLFKREDKWKFYTIGEGVEAKKILALVAIIKERYL
jgi:tellurium resistance protein TerZ